MNDFTHLDTAPQPIRLRIEDYLALESAGAFEGYAKTELLEGELFYINAQYRPHARLKMRLYDLLRDALHAIGSDLTPIIEVTIQVLDHSLPEPDIVLTSEPDGEGFVPLETVALIVEIADTTVKSDLTRKAGLYGRAGVPEYWVADLPARTVHQFWAPGPGGYTESQSLAFGGRLKAASLPIAVDLPE